MESCCRHEGYYSTQVSTLRMEDVYNTIHDEYPQLKKQLEIILEKELIRAEDE